MDTTRHLEDFAAYSPGLSPIVSTFCSSLIKSHKMKLRLKFLRDCLQEQVLPKSLGNYRLLKLCNKPFEEFHQIILQKHIDITRFEVRELFKICKSARQSFHQAIPETWKPRLLDFCYGKMRSVCKKLSHKLKKKLTNLIANSDWSKHANSNFMINLSDKPLSSDVKCALGYGLSFANQHIDYVDVAKGFFPVTGVPYTLSPTLKTPIVIVTWRWVYLGMWCKCALRNTFLATQLRTVHVMVARLRAWIRIRDISARNKKLASLDVKSLFTCVPSDKVIDLLRDKIKYEKIDFLLPPNDLIQLCVEFSYFKFQDHHFHQKFGMDIGSPLSAVLPNMFMIFLESGPFADIVPEHVTWLRYVDDILLITPR
ncbi:uncharacterized protein LOC143034564 [Oratosquilla oratoria]|uniref:uncharacterized protein LOC143034564 n=1 Tax=Oratosquilla oratoria TaxID=337810 RepID=UPI003F76506B